jgi:phosphate uptake regulator
MKRKLVHQGNGALTLTLPYSWIQKNNLKKGDYLDLTESGKDLILSSDAVKLNKSYEINISQDKPFFKRYLRTCYVLGYDSIILSTDSILPLSQLKEALSSLIGYEVTEQTAKKCVVSMVALPHDENFDTILKRIFFMIESMLNDIISAIQSKNLKPLQEIAYMEGSINTFVDFCLRILNKKGYSDFHKTPYLYQILISLEQIGDALRDFCNNLNSIDKDLLKLLNQIKEYYSQIQSLFFKYDMRKIKKVKEQRIELFKDTRALSLELPKNMLDLYLLISTLHQIEIALDPINN